MLQQHGGAVLALDLRVHPLGAAGDRGDLAEVEARHVEDVHADVRDGEPLLGREVGLLGVDVVAGAEGDPARNAACRSGPAPISSPILRSGGWKRKFSCTISGTPAFAQAATIASQSARVGPNGFCTMAGTFMLAASSTSGRCEGTVVAMSTKSGFVSRSMVAASV